MPKPTVFIIAVFFATTACAQDISIKKDTIFSGSERIALFKTSTKGPDRYFITTFGGDELIALHRSMVTENGKPGYIVTFVHDDGQGILAKQSGFPLSMVSELCKGNLLKKDGSIDHKSEVEFLIAHPLPKGYTDMDQVVE